MLKRRFKDIGLKHPVGLFSKALSDYERNNAAYDLELYAVVRAVKHFWMFQIVRKFLLRQDHVAFRSRFRRHLFSTTLDKR